MSPHRSGPLAYWHSGGTIESRLGQLSRSRAGALCRFFAGEVIAAVDRRDDAAVIFCARALSEIGSAIVAADAWRAASARRQVRVSHESAALWLRKA
jgi:hypothetical protein